MSVKYLNGRTYYVLLSDDNWATTYTLVCLSKQGLDRERSVSKQETQCEMAKSFGIVDRSFTADCVTNLTPAAVAAGVGEASYKKLSTWFEAGTELRWKRKSPADGSDQYQESRCVINKLSDAVEVNNNQSFSLSFELVGDFDETP